MAISNRDRVSRGFELLADGLAPFVDQVMAAAMPAGQDWVALLAARDGAKFGNERAYSKTDPQLLLKVLTEEWRIFKDRLSRPEQAMASELREARNRWAHNDGFNADDTYRALDSMERLLIAAGAAEQADGVRRLRVDHQRAQYESETRKAVKAAAVASVPGTGIKPWREIITPHPDVASGQYNAAEFAADLHVVARGEASDEFVDAVQFFRRTYVTEGLRDMLGRAARRLTGDANASPVVNLQTNFGGGKTHSMLALYHLCSGTPVSALPQEVQEAVAGVDLAGAGEIRRVTLVGNHLSPGQPSVKEDGTEVRTLWGELAWQLAPQRADLGAVFLDRRLPRRQVVADQRDAADLAGTGEVDARDRLLHLLRQRAHRCARAQVVQREHRVGLAPAEVGLQVDDRAGVGVTGEAPRRAAEQVPQPLGDVGAPEELHRVDELVAALAARNHVQVGGELRGVVLAAGHVRGGGDDLPPGLDAGAGHACHRRRADGLARPGLVLRPLVIHAQAADPVRLRVDHQRAQY